MGLPLSNEWLDWVGSALLRQDFTFGGASRSVFCTLCDVGQTVNQLVTRAAFAASSLQLAAIHL